MEKAARVCMEGSWEGLCAGVWRVTSMANRAARQKRVQAQVGRPLLRKSFKSSTLKTFSQGKNTRSHKNPESMGVHFSAARVLLTENT